METLSVKKRGIALILAISFIFLLGNVFAESVLSTSSVCCEKTKSGAFCLNADESSCDSSGRVVPTSCESTSFCKLGTCYDSKEGLCLENVPQRVCQANGGTWSDKSANQIAQCKLGCCILADQASFVTMTRCKSLSTFYGMKIDFRSTITSEASCVAAANSQDEGACVYFEAGVKTCKFTTRQECGGTTTTSSEVLNASEIEDIAGKYFYKGLLCSAEELGVPNAARQASTKCYGGKVYWYDSLGNKENVYSSNSNLSWNNGRVASEDSICAKTGDSKTCGNCDYIAGSRCAAWDTSIFNAFGITKPSNVNNYCKTTKCTDRDGNVRLNGESWCVYDGEVGNAADSAGSRHYREICVDGKVQVEACEDFRNQICVHSGIQTTAGEYSVAACRVNRWQDCTAQDNKDDCENTDARDCLWIKEVDGITLTNTGAKSSSSGNAFNNPVSSASSGVNAQSLNSATQGIQATSSLVSSINTLATGAVIKHVIGSGVGGWEENDIGNEWRVNRSESDDSDDDGYRDLCVPLVSPGLDFWQSGSSSTVCGQATATCSVKVTRNYKKNILTGSKELESVEVEDNECLTKNGSNSFSVREDWAIKANAVCSAMGDCGAGYNFNQIFVNDGYNWKYGGDSYYFIESDLPRLDKSLTYPTTGDAILDYVINDKYQLKQGETVYVKA